MIWRKGYSTEVYRDVETCVPDGVWIGATSASSVADTGTWIRLLGQAGIDYRFLFLGTADDLESLVAPSVFRRTVFIDELPEVVRDRAFGMVVSAGRGKVLMAGLPTEEAWDEFVAVADDGGDKLRY